MSDTFDLFDIDPTEVSFVKRASVRDPDQPTEPMRLLFWKTEAHPHYSIDADGLCSSCGVEVASFAKKDMDPNVGGGVDRDKLEDSDFVLADERKFPVVKPGDVSDAVSSWGRYRGDTSFEDFKSKLTALAQRKGDAFVAALPDEWKSELKKKEAPKVPENVNVNKADGGDDDGDGAMDADNQIKGAMAMLSKHDKAGNLTDEHKAALAKFAKAEGEPVSIDKSELPEPVRIALEKAEADAKAAREHAARIDSERAAERVQLRKGELVRFAKGEASHVPGATADELADIIQTVEQSKPEMGEKLVQVLKSASAAIKEGELFTIKSRVADGGGVESPLGRLNAMAVEIQKSEADLSYEQAYAKAMATPEGASLYEESKRA